jgi:hypothetical protein
MTEQEMAKALVELLTDEVGGDELADKLRAELEEVRTFEEERVLTSGEGFVLRMADGSEFSVKVTRRGGPDG